MELEILSTAAQIAVALAGFAGVVVVFRRESVHEWSPIDRCRLRLLLSNSVFPLAYSLFAMLLLGVKPPRPHGALWRRRWRRSFGRHLGVGWEALDVAAEVEKRWPHQAVDAVIDPK